MTEPTSTKTKKPPAITSITLENFKGVGKAITVPLKPITLLFGENSAGKSTILHGLLYLSEVLSKRVADVDQVALSGASISLGGFKSFVHKHDLTREVRVGVSCSLGDAKIDEPTSYEQLSDKWQYEDEYAALNINTLLPITEVSIEVTVYAGGPPGPIIKHIGVGVNGSLVLKGTLGDKDVWQLPTYDLVDTHPLIAAAYSKAPFLQSDMAACRDHGEVTFFSVMDDSDLVPKLDATLRVIFPDPQDYGEDDETFEMSEFDGPFSAFFWQLLVGIPRLILGQLNALRYTGPLRSAPPRHGISHWQNSSANWADGSAAWELLVSPRANLSDQPPMETGPVTGSEASGWTEENGIKVHKPSLGRFTEQIRVMCTPPERRSYKDDRLIPLINELLEVSDLAYEIKGVRSVLLDESVPQLKELTAAGVSSETVKQFVDFLSQLPRQRSFRLVDKRNSTELHPSELGMGVSQALPVIIGSIISGFSVYAVEQPELHLHPKAQSGLGDVFIIGAKGLQRRYIIETHSEHLILRILRRIRECSQGKAESGALSITPSDIQVLYVEQTEQGLQITSLPVDDDGEFTRPWPKGFFEERAEELF